MEKRQRLLLIGGIIIGSVLIMIAIILGSVLPRAAPKSIPATRNNTNECPVEYGFNPVLLVSLDGFRADYLKRGLTPNIQALADAGVTTPYMKPSYPSVTFPNHYTIVTGTYPESHGIIGNKFFDPEFKRRFKLGSELQREGRWWGAQPVWNTLSNQGRKSATYFWPGSDANINGTYPTYYFPYNGNVPFEDRVDKVLEWVAMDESVRPNFISLYFNEPDHTGHDGGPDSPQVNEQLVRMDGIIRRLTEGIMEQGHAGCVNLIIVADHGMATSGEEKSFELAKYIPNITDFAFTNSGAFGRINPKDSAPDKEPKFDMLKKLVCKDPKMRAFVKEDLPTRYHFSNNPRIEDIVLDLDPGYFISYSDGFFLKGQHGYDNYFSSMNALFLAVGPAFKEGLEVEPFQNIDLYNLMCHLAGVDPAPNNGTQGSLDHLLKSPSPRNPLPEERKPPTAKFPSVKELQNKLGISGCPGDLQTPEDWVHSLNLSDSIQSKLEQDHLPWGIPHSGDLLADVILLHQDDYVIGYSNTLRMPLWTAFTVTDSIREISFLEWSSDPRLTEGTTPTCASYDALKNISMEQLFPPGYSKNISAERVPYLVSNAIPMTNQVSKNWKELLGEKLSGWVQKYGTVNVIVGPVFDNNADSHPDDITTFGSPPEVPSDLFIVMTRCRKKIPLDHCNPTDLDAQAFIYPLKHKVSNCLEPNQYMLMFSAKVHDVELATGLSLYPKLEVYDRIRLLLRIHDTLWN